MYDHCAIFQGLKQSISHLTSSLLFLHHINHRSFMHIFTRLRQFVIHCAQLLHALYGNMQEESLPLQLYILYIEIDR